MTPKNHPSEQTVRRVVSFEKCVNFRDLGGYQTKTGQRIQTQRLYRSAGLSMLTDSDRARLIHLGVKTVIDLRSQNEVERSPDRLPDDGSIQYRHFPITFSGYDVADLFDRLRRGDADWMTDDFMTKSYLAYLEEFPHVWGEIFGLLAIPENLPLIFHCTGGKDRTGTMAALILLVLGVDRQRVVTDHQLSNRLLAEITKALQVQVETFGIDPNKMLPYFSAPLDAIEALLDYIETTYGSAERYLQEKAGVDNCHIAAIRQELLGK